MKIMICGGAGFIGQNLTRHFLERGHQIVILDRNQSRIASPELLSFQADLLDPGLFRKEWFKGVDAVINLSGKEIFTLWTEKNREMIRRSRIEVTRNLVGFIAGLTQRPGVFVSASAVGYYGDGKEADLAESKVHGQGFLADVCVAWEAEARRAEDLGMRSVQIRTAPVLLRSGGILLHLLKAMRSGIAFTFGSGNQWFSWIHMTDLLRIYHLAVTDKSLSGPVNACSPNPVRFQDFMGRLTKYKRAVILPFPGWLLKVFLQETADVVLFSQKMSPSKLLERNFQFSFPILDVALQDVFTEKT